MMDGNVGFAIRAFLFDLLFTESHYYNMLGSLKICTRADVSRAVASIEW